MGVLFASGVIGVSSGAMRVSNGHMTPTTHTLWGYDPQASIQPTELWYGSNAECQAEADYLFRTAPQWTHLGVYPSRIAGQDFIPQYFLRNCDLRARRAW